MAAFASEEVVIAGKGLHRGRAGSIRFRKRPNDSQGPRFFWPGWPEPLPAQRLPFLTRENNRATVLREAGDRVFHTPEHLLAAGLFYHDAPLDILCDASEPPGLDGSAQPFWEAMNRLSPEAGAYPAWKTFASRLRWEYQGPEGHVTAEPAETFSVEYAWEVAGLRQHFTLYDPITAVREILPARTFIFFRAFKSDALRPDRLQGANLNSGLLLAESEEEFAEVRKAHPRLRGTDFPLLHPEKFRLDRELVKHKILDLLGDLALSGLALPRLRLRIRNGGHALNHLLLERLRND